MKKFLQKKSVGKYFVILLEMPLGGRNPITAGV
jgi:hypothetical protein